MSDSNAALAPFLHRARVRALAPQIESLAEEYARECEPVRHALNAVLEAGDGWVRPLYERGPALAQLDLSDAAWGWNAPPDRTCSDTSLAGYARLQLARAAAAADWDEFARWVGHLIDEPPILREVAASMPNFALCVCARALRNSRGRTMERFRVLLHGVEIEFSWGMLCELRRFGCDLTPAAEDAARHWLDQDAAPCRLENGLLVPPGYRNEDRPEPLSEGEEDAPEADDTGPIDDAAAKAAFLKLPPAVQRAFRQYRQAVRALTDSGELCESDITDQQVYDHLKEIEVRLPDFENWTRYLRQARKALGTQKRKPRARYVGRSAVTRDHFGPRRKKNSD